ncbi:MAG: nucleoside-diphosphate sugar epimerase/dehydratase [Kiritimatiellae bacterium]|jgi:FlaA1/EpsC-like NDP-sugar epimerase|nr:nucleoside-diphosphate sugar epimerase/dehydratase [Kiritimatiellia bacterium]
MLKRFRIALFVMLDILIFALAFISAMLLRFEFKLDNQLQQTYEEAIMIVAIMSLSMVLLKIYKSLWIYTSINELMRIFVAIGVPSFILFIVNSFLPTRQVPQSVIIMMFILSYMGVGGSRVLYRILRMRKSYIFAKNKCLKNVLIIGAGDAGRMLLNEIRMNNSLSYKIVGFLDDNKNKFGRNINGIKIVGESKDVVEITKKHSVDLIIFAIPSMDPKEQREILNLCSETKVEVKTLPPISNWMTDASALTQMKEVDIADLLGREQVELDKQGVNDYLRDKVVLVTGGGGSIGSELVRQLVAYDTKKVVVVDIYENTTYELEREISHLATQVDPSTTDIEVYISSVRDYAQMEKLFKKIKPDIIFHAAAHKHVPLMERTPQEAIKNNIFGTFNVAKLAKKYEAERFILISTDKAVRPTNVMGATKRFAEMIIQAHGNEQNCKTKFSCVRFGNVLGSNGSVIPLFKEQIKKGGPVTVTDANIIRYFMTIPEAASLVIQAGLYANQGEIFVLDMGEPVKIINLAEKIIRLSGYTPYEEIKIEFLGLRPGEKMYEELLVDKVDQQKTPCKKIFIEERESHSMANILSYIEELSEIIQNDEHIDYKEILKKHVDTYLPEGLKNIKLGKGADYAQRTKRQN